MKKIIAALFILSVILHAPIAIAEMSGIGLDPKEWSDYFSQMLEMKGVEVDTELVDNQDNNPSYEISFGKNGLTYTTYMIVYTDEGLTSTVYFVCELPENQSEEYSKAIDMVASTAIYTAGMYDDENSDTRDRMFLGMRSFEEDMINRRGVDQISIANSGHSFTMTYSKRESEECPDTLIISIT